MPMFSASALPPLRFWMRVMGVFQARVSYTASTCWHRSRRWMGRLMRNMWKASRRIWAVSSVEPSSTTMIS